MKLFKKRFFSLLLAALLIASMSIPTMATSDPDEQTRASAYISYCFARTTVSGGDVNVYFRITGTGTMTSIGATDIIIYDENDNWVALLDSSNTAGLMGSNTFFYSNTVSWNGAVSGMRYYAIVGFKAANSNGYDTTCFTTLYSS